MADIQSNIKVNIDTSNALAGIKSLQSQISAFHTSMARGSADAVTASSQLQQRLLNSLNATGKFAAEIRNIKTTTESFTTALEKNKLSMGEYFRYAGGASRSFGKFFTSELNTIEKVARERVKSLQTQYISMGRDASGALKAIAIRPLALDLQDLGTKTAIAAQKQQILNQLLKQGSTNLLNFGKNTQWAGRQLMVGFTIPMAVAGTTAAKAYMDLEKATIRLKRVYGDLGTTAQETNRIAQQIQELAASYTQYGTAVADTMDMAAQAAAMGKTGADLLAQVDQATKLSVLGGVDQTTALQTTISLTNSFGISSEKLAGKINFLNAVENQTITSIEDLTTAIPKAGPVVQQLGGNVEDLTFFLTAMREGGINASEGANALKSGLASLINPSKKASEFLAGFGVNVKGIVEQDKGNLKKTVVDFALALDKIDPLNRARAIEMMFGKFQFARISTLLQNVTKDGSQASKVLELSGSSAIQLAALSRKELDKVASSPLYKFEKAIADFQLKMAPVGEAFLKAITPVINFGSDMLKNFNGMGDGAKQFAIIATTAIAGIGPILLMTFGLIANGVANIIKLFANIKSFFNRTTSSSKVLGETVSYMTTQEIEAASVAASLDQIHSKLTQTFTSEAASVNLLTAALERAVTAQNLFRGTSGVAAVTPKNFATGGVVTGPGTATSDSVPANLSNGEVVLSVDTVKKNTAVVGALLSGRKVNVAGFNGGGVAGGQMIARSHTALPFDQGSEQWSAGVKIAGLESLAAEFPQFVKVVSNLVAELPQKLNVGMIKGVSQEKFSDGWNSRENKMLGSARLGGLDINNTDNIAAVKELEQRIHDRTIAIAKGTEDQKVTDEILAKATREVIDETKSEKTAIGSASRALDTSSKQIGQVRVQVPTADVRAGLESGKLTKGANGSVMYGDIQVARESQSKPGKFRPASSYNPTKSYSREELRGSAIAGENAVTEVSDTIAKGAKKRAKIQSPSKETMKIGEDLAQGALDGMKSKAKEAKSAGKKFVDATSLNAVSTKSSGGSMPIDAKPVTYSQAAINSASRPSRPSRVASPFVQRIKASIAAAPENFANERRMLSQEAKSIFEQLKGIFKIGGKQAIDAVQTGVIQETPRLVVAGKEAGFDYVAALKGGNGSISAVVTAGNQKIIANALKEYNAGGFRVAGAVSLGLDKGIAAELAKGIVVGKRLADSVLEGAQQEALMAPSAKMPRNQEGPLLPGQVRQGPTLSQRWSNTKTKMASAIDDKMSGSTTGSLAKLGVAASSAVFALSMIPGPVGQFAQMLLPIISIGSMLAPMFAGLATATGATIGTMVVAALPVVAVLGLLAGGIALAVIANNNYQDAKKKELAAINASTNAYKYAKGAVNELASLAGITVGKNPMDSAGIAMENGLTGKQASDTQTLLASAEFKNPESNISKLVDSVKGMSDTAATDFLSSYANQLKGFGFDEKTIDSMLTAIKIKAEKTNLKLKFASIDISTKEGQAQLQKGTKDAIEAVDSTKGLEDKLAAEKKQIAQTTTIGGLTQKQNDDKLSGAKATLAQYEKRGITSGSGYSAAKADITRYETQKLGFAGQIKSKQDAAAAKTEYAPIAANKKTAVDTIKTNVTGALSQFGTKQINSSQFKASINSIISGMGKGKSAVNSMSKAIEGLNSPKANAANKTIVGLGGVVAKGGKKFDAAAEQLKYFAVVSANPDMGATLTTRLAEIEAGAGSVEQKALDTANAINGIYDSLAKTDSKVTNFVPDTATDTTGGDTTKPSDMLRDLKATAAGRAITASFIKQGYNSEFSSMLADADKKTQNYYTTIKNGKRVLNEHGKALLAAFNAKVVGDYLNANAQVARDAKSELMVRAKLVASGIKYTDAVEAAKDSTLQGAIAAAKNKAEVDKIIASWKAVKTAQDSTKTAEDLFNEVSDKANAYFDSNQNAIELKFKADPTNIANQKTITDAQNEIAAKQYQQNAFDAGLKSIADRETEINKTYDERVKALDEIQKANDAINKQNQSQLTLADALSRGDISAAAKAAQDARAQSASDSMSNQKDRMAKAHEEQLAGLTAVVNGKAMTRLEIEDAVKKIQDDIYAIEQNRLKPAQEAIRLAEVKKTADLEALDQQKLQWDLMNSKIALAKNGVFDYLSALKEAQGYLNNIPGISGAKADARASYTAAATAGMDAVQAAAKIMMLSGQNVSAPGSFMNTYGYLGMSSGGMVPKYFASGGFARGTDTIPAMLTPGEFVVRKAAVDSLGSGALGAINSGTPVGNSMYNNYNLNVNVRSEANPDLIARTVITQIQQIDSQRIRGNRL
jgi:TP901 family phage tail tape measure protein